MVEDLLANWQHFNPVKIMAGSGQLNSLGQFLPIEGKVLLVTTEGFTRRGVTEKIIASLYDRSIVVFDSVLPNPEVDYLDQAVTAFRKEKIASVVGIGGGSVLDAAKAFAVLLYAENSMSLDEVFRNKLPANWNGSLPLVLVPTTSGTGSEVTPFATIWDNRIKAKYSLAGDYVFAKTAILDPALTISLPEDETIYSAMDACSHSLESLWNVNCSPVSAACAALALRLIVKSLPQVITCPDDIEARSHLQSASLLAGIAISHTKTAVAHSISYPLTSHFGVPHGLACSFTLPVLIEENFELLVARTGDNSLIISVRSLIKTLNLGEKMQKFASFTQIVSVKDEMINPARFANYIRSNQVSIQDILEKSLYK